MPRNIPNLSAKFVCIVDHEKQDFAAVISSYIATRDYYPLIFEFPTVRSPHYDRKGEEIDENMLSVMRAVEFRTFLNNILVRLLPVENLIIAGLSDDQKSYLDFLKYFNVIEINTFDQIDFQLSSFIEGKRKVECSSNDLLNGLTAALRSNSILQLKEDVPQIDLENSGGKGLVVIEAESQVATIIAVNYAFSIDADIVFIASVSEDERLAILDKFTEFGAGNKRAGDEIRQFIDQRICHIDFNKSEFVTYFTAGLPYSFVTSKFIPSTYVNCHLRPDFFIANNLIFHRTVRFGGAVVFSPEFFKDEETGLVSKLLTQAHYFVKDLFGKDADIFNFDMNMKQFPFDIFHICSHGGEIEGHTVEEDFIDSDGVKHTVIYEQILSISASMRPGLIQLQRKSYFKLFDGMVWRSPELRAKKIPHYVFADMQNALRVSKSVDKKVGPKKKINNSSGIQCSDGPHLAMFATIACQSSPFIFNNTCWSWYHVAETFLVAGARCYIGTFWNVENKVAIDFASMFYNLAFSHSIMDAVHQSLNSIAGTTSENIYMFWGLHFNKLSHSESIERSRERVFEELMYSSGIWQDNLKSARLKSTRDMILDLLQWIYMESEITFTGNDYTIFKTKLQEGKLGKKGNQF